MNDQIIIMGIGNWLMSDDGVGVHAARSLAQDPPADVLVVDAGTDALSALSFLEEATRVLLIDAVRWGGAPGTIRRFTEDEVSSPPGRHPAHAVHLFGSRHLFRPDAEWPEFLILGVEPASMTYGMELTPIVAAVLPQVIQLSREIVTAWKSETVLT